MTDNKARVSGIITAFEAGWSAISDLEPDVPKDISIIVASRGRRGLNGYHLPQKWAVDPQANGSSLSAGEVMIAAEGLDRGANALFTTLLHEATHAQCWAKGLRDTSQGGRYHNAVFAEQAARMGLNVVKGEHGYETVGMADRTAIRYATYIQNLDRALKLYRKAEPQIIQGPNKNLLKAVCQCPSDNSLRTSRRRLAKGLVCPDCGTYFVGVEPIPVGSVVPFLVPQGWRA